MPGTDGSAPAAGDTARRSRHVVLTLLAAAFGGILGTGAVLFAVLRVVGVVVDMPDGVRLYVVAGAPMIVVTIASCVYARAFYPAVIGFVAYLLVVNGAAGHERALVLHERGVVRDGVVLEHEKREYHTAWQVGIHDHCVVEYVVDDRVERLSRTSIQGARWCVDARVGERVTLTVDPEGKLEPSVGELPGTLRFRVSLGLGGTVYVLVLAAAVASGYALRTCPPAAEDAQSPVTGR